MGLEIALIAVALAIILFALIFCYCRTRGNIKHYEAQVSVRVDGGAGFGLKGSSFKDKKANQVFLKPETPIRKETQWIVQPIESFEVAQLVDPKISHLIEESDLLSL